MLTVPKSCTSYTYCRFKAKISNENEKVCDKLAQLQKEYKDIQSALRQKNVELKSYEMR